MNVFILTSVYPSQYAPKGTTPVVHYFAKEWALAGHKVRVFHTGSTFPKAYYFLAKPFKRFMDTRLGFAMPTQIPKEYNETKDGVEVCHLLLKKAKPHGRYPKRQIQKALGVISFYIKQEGVPDCFVGHWDNPQLELLHALKEKYHRPTCLVYHNIDFSQMGKLYGDETEALVSDIDLVGFRSIKAQADYETCFKKPSRSFIAASGVSRPFIEAGKGFCKEFGKIERFIYVGTLIRRKYPTVVIDALHQSYRQEPFEITYIGEGNDKRQIQQRFDELECKGELVFTGRIAREEVIQYLKKSDVFVMVSKDEVFGLVYLEAMALGCITIASRHEGIDGIIEDGENGFLCEAGNAEELTRIISRIRSMSHEELQEMSRKAKITANAYSDINVAKRYLEELRLC